MEHSGWSHRSPCTVTLYLGTSNSLDIRDAITSGEIGRLCTPQGGSPPEEGTWAADSGCFTLGERFSLDRYLNWLDRMEPHKDRCLFAPAPDVVGDHGATVLRSAPVLPQIRARGYRAAFVAQNGATPENTPWGTFDVLFVGGSLECDSSCRYTYDLPHPPVRGERCPWCDEMMTEWKLSRAAQILCDAAKEKGLWIHVGRVNSAKRYRFVRDVLHADSADGTYLSFGPAVNLSRLRCWN